MNQENNSNVSGKYPLASRSSRFFAAMLDQIFTLIFLYPIWAHHDWLEFFMNPSVQPPYQVVLLSSVYAFIIFLLLNSYLLYKYGQTLGKRVLGIAVATEDQQVMEFNRLIALRYLPFRILEVIPVLVLILLVDVLFIFRADKKCLHDILAGTCVIDVGVKNRPRPD